MMQVFYNSTILVVQKWKGDGDVAQKYIGFARGTHCITVFEIQRPIKHTRVDLFHYMYIGHNGISTIHTKFTAICRSVSILSNYSLLSRLFCKKSTPVLVPPVPAVCAKIPKREQNT